MIDINLGLLLEVGPVRLPIARGRDTSLTSLTSRSDDRWLAKCQIRLGLTHVPTSLLPLNNFTSLVHPKTTLCCTL